MLGLDRRIGWVIFVLALILRLAWSLHLQNQTYWIDEDDFFDIAQHIVHGMGTYREVFAPIRRCLTTWPRWRKSPGRIIFWLPRASGKVYWEH